MDFRLPRYCHPHSHLGIQSPRRWPPGCPGPAIEGVETMTPGRKPILEIRGLRTQFFLQEGTVTALDGIDLTVYERESVGIVGETGCGKSMTAFSILRLVPHPGRITGGSIQFKGIDVTKLDLDQMRGIGGRESR